MKALHIALAALGTFAIMESQAQVKLGNGQISGSFETSTAYYMEDKGINANTPEDHFGSNNYLKLDYTNNRFSAGIQADAYLPALQGYDIGIYGEKQFYLSTKYVSWQDDNYGFLVGDIFDQYGNGLIYRSFEDRQLGFNNSIEGVHARYNFNNYVNLKAMYGRPRLYTEYASSWVRGADLSVSLNEIIGMKNILLSLEGSYVNRYQKLVRDGYFDPAKDYGMKPNLDMYSGRLNFNWNGLSLQGEYVHKGKDLYNIAAGVEGGNAILASLAYNYNTFSVSGTFRRLERMNTMLSLYGSGSGNVLNYLPALTRQYTYMLANLNPYKVNSDGEIGGQIDVYYSLRNKKNRNSYWNFHANFSTYYSLEPLYGAEKQALYWRDFNFDVERKWNKSLKTTFLYSRQEYEVVHGDSELAASNIFVVDALYKINRKHSLRFEVQYLLGDKYEGYFPGSYEGDWVAALVEYNIAPKWSVFVSDMYNHGNDNVDNRNHYYNGGFSFTHHRTRVQLSYGRNREGYVCSGGVCRFTPAYTGFNLSLTSSF